MGRYVLEENKTAMLKPVYKKTDGAYYIFYSRKLYFILLIRVSQLYLPLQRLVAGLFMRTIRLAMDGCGVRREDY